MNNIVYIEIKISFDIDIECIAIDILIADAFNSNVVFVCDVVSTERRTTWRERKRNQKMN